MNVGQLCIRGASTVCASAPLIDAAQLLCRYGLDAAVVITAPAERPTAIGIITDRDIVHAQIKRAAEFAQLRVLDVLARNPLVLNEEDTPANAILQLRARRVRNAPVVGPGGTLCGTIALDDLLSHVSAELARLLEAATRDRRSPL